MDWRGIVLSLAYMCSLLIMVSSDSSSIPEVSRAYYPLIYSIYEQQLNIPCPVSDATFVNWYKDKMPVIESGEIRVRSSGEFNLTIKSVKYEDAGVYSCEAVNGFGSLHRLNFTVRVLDADSTTPSPDTLQMIKPGEFAPNFENNPPGPSELHLDPGSSQKLRCRADGNPRPEIEWYKNGQLLTQSGNTESFALKLNNIQENEAGLYMCRVFNNLGSINFTYTISITDRRTAAEVVPPYPLNTSVTYGTPASLQCKVKSQSRPTIRWLREVATPTKNSTTIDNKHYVLVRDEATVKETETGTYLNTLLIPRVTYEDEGVYICSGINQRGGSDIRKAYIKVVPDVTLTTARRIDPSEEATWDYIFGSPSATLAVLIAIPVVIILVLAIGIIYCLNKRKKAPAVRRQTNNMLHDHEVSVPLNMNGNNASFNGHYTGKMSLTSADPYYSDKMYPPSTYKQPVAQQYSQYSQSDGSYRSGLMYPAALPVVHNTYMTAAAVSVGDIPDSDSHFSSVSHTRPQYMTNNHPYERDIQSDPPLSRLGHHQCPPPPPGSYYSGQW